MNQIFVETLSEKFPNQFEIKTDEKYTFIKFPAKNPDFGDVDIYEDYPGEYIVNVGHFTHGHFDCYNGSEEEQAREAAETIADFLETLFADGIICYGSHEKGGGCYRKGHSDAIYGDDVGGFVWSGADHKPNTM